MPTQYPQYVQNVQNVQNAQMVAPMYVPQQAAVDMTYANPTTGEIASQYLPIAQPIQAYEPSSGYMFSLMLSDRIDMCLPQRIQRTLCKFFDDCSMIYRVKFCPHCQKDVAVLKKANSISES